MPAANKMRTIVPGTVCKIRLLTKRELRSVTSPSKRTLLIEAPASPRALTKVLLATSALTRPPPLIWVLMPKLMPQPTTMLFTITWPKLGGGFTVSFSKSSSRSDSPADGLRGVWLLQ